MLGKLQVIRAILPFLLSFYFTASVDANPVVTSEMELKAKRAYQAGNYQKAVSLWSNILQQPDLKTATRANIYSNQAALYRQIGQPEKAILAWQKAIALYRQEKGERSQRLLAEVLVDQAQVHNALGQTDFSVPLLQEAIKIASQENLTEIEAIGYQASGNAHTIVREYDLAVLNYSKSLAAAKQIDDSKLVVVALNNLSNSYDRKYQQLVSQAESAQELGKLEAEDIFKQASFTANKAWHYAVEAVEESGSSQSLFSVEAIIQLVKLSKTYSKEKMAEPIFVEDYLRRANKILLSLPNSQRKTQALINLAELQENPVTTLDYALKVSESIQDKKTQSMALGYLGAYYEQKHDYDKAIALTHQAQQLAGQVRAADLQYRWDWQAGRIYRALGRDQDAMRAYQQAIASLQLIRSDLATAGDELQIDFQLEVEPVYRELIELLLATGNSESEIRQALEVKDLLQLSELENFFGDDCTIVKADESNSADSESEKTTVVNTIILKQNTYLILQLPNGRVKSFQMPISAQEMSQMVEQWRYDLENQESDSYLALSRKLYQLLIEIIEPELTATGTERLVFVNDGILRNVPMAALHDGERFLIEKYAVANSLGFDLKLNESSPSEVDILAFGLTSGSADSRPLPYVREELAQIDGITESKSFLDQEFNVDNFVKQTEKDKYDVIHIATHGEFGGTARQTYLQVYNQKIGLKELEQILNQRSRDSRVNLLTLSACDTAVSSDRAILGLAGVAIRSNVDNVLGSLWSVSDEQMVSFTSDFYRYWIEDELTKSQALRSAQIDLIKRPDFHPAIWSSLILIES
jgi:CHAT domain-containing protein